MMLYASAYYQEGSSQLSSILGEPACGDIEHGLMRCFPWVA